MDVVPCLVRLAKALFVVGFKGFLSLVEPNRRGSLPGKKTGFASACHWLFLLLRLDFEEGRDHFVEGCIYIGREEGQRQGQARFPHGNIVTLTPAHESTRRVGMFSKVEAMIPYFAIIN